MPRGLRGSPKIDMHFNNSVIPGFVFWVLSSSDITQSDHESPKHVKSSNQRIWHKKINFYDFAITVGRMSLPLEQGLHEYIEYFCADLWIVCEQVTQRRWKRKRPMSDRHIREHTFIQERGCLVHSTARATTTDRSCFTTMGQKAIVSASRTSKVCESMSRITAPQHGL